MFNALALFVGGSLKIIMWDEFSTFQQNLLANISSMYLRIELEKERKSKRNEKNEKIDVIFMVGNECEILFGEKSCGKEKEIN